MNEKEEAKMVYYPYNFSLRNSRGQVSTEALIIMGFILLLIVSLLGVAFLYVRGINDRIKGNQVNNYADKLISASEDVYYSGEPSRVTINVFVPESIESINIIDKNLVINISLSTGNSLMAFPSSVNLEGNLSINAGVKKIQIEALTDRVRLTELE